MKSDAKPEVCVVGLGYIGLPTAAIVARAGCKVRGIDVSQAVVDTINRGEIHIEEVDLDGLVHGVVARGLLSASTEMAPADVFVIAVPTACSGLPDGSSTLMTSAPRSPRMNVEMGPATALVKSMTRIPSSGRTTLDNPHCVGPGQVFGLEIQ